MIFEIDTVGDLYSSPDADRLRSLGFEFTKEDLVEIKTKSGTPIDFTTLEELMSFAREWSPTGDVIIDSSARKLIIFDDYVS